MEFFERPDAGERTLAIHIETGRNDEIAAEQEFAELVGSTGAEVVCRISVVLRNPDPRQLIGSGKAAELRQLVELHEPDLAILNHSLSPSQERNLERQLGCRVLDRAGLILDIFARRARSAEGQMQVELAQLRHLSTRLVKGWTHLERQKGGIGLRGPGETQLETDRRLISQRIVRIQRQLEKVVKRRALGKRARQQAELPLVALVGYTNAGKSTLFNALTDACVLVEDKLFATLDPTLRRIDLAQGVPAILADTVGFISDLPHELVAAFRATLDETRSADLLLHVIDAANPMQDDLIEEVQHVLEQIGADQIPQIKVMNKLDALDEDARAFEIEHAWHTQRAAVSAISGEGLEQLNALMAEFFLRLRPVHKLHLPPLAAQLRAQIYQQGTVLEETTEDDGSILLRCQLSERNYRSLAKQWPEWLPITST